MQEKRRANKEAVTDEEAQHLGEAATQSKEAKEQLDTDIDAILDEIDDVLEENAEDFVKAFVQKGGQ
jgi:ubiquitin-like protein Pup